MIKINKVMIFIVMFLISISIVVALIPPQFLLFQGNVRIDNRPALENTLVNFSIQGVELDSSSVVSGEYNVMIQGYSRFYGEPIDITIIPVNIEEYEEDFYEAEQEINYNYPQDVFLNLTTFTERALEIYFPEKEEIIISKAGDVDFNVIAKTGYNEEIEKNKIKYKWYKNDELISGEDTNFYSYYVNNNDYGIYDIRAEVYDNYITREKEWTLIIGKPIIDEDEFDGDTTNFSDITLDLLNNVPNVVFEKSVNGKIEFLENLDLRGVYDIDKNVKIENGVVAINTGDPTYSELSKKARITLRNLRYNSIPIIYYSDGFTTNKNKINQECDFCNLINYTDFPTTNGEIIFEVKHFSSFTIKESGKIYDLDLFKDLDVCEINGNLKVNIKEPDNNDDFKFGDEIEIEVEVENNNNEDLDVIVEAILYNIDEDDEVEKVESKDEEINDNDEETFELKLKIPSNFDEDDDYILFVRAYEDDNEDEQCNYDLIDLSLEKEKHDVIIKEMKIMPNNVPEGGSFKALVEIENIGRKDVDVYVRLENEELNINLESNKFKLKDDEIKNIRFDVIIPEDIESKDYDLKAVVYFDNEEVSKEGKLNVEKEEQIKRISVSEESFPIKLNIIKDVLNIKEDIFEPIINDFINVQEDVFSLTKKIPSCIHVILFLIVVGLALAVIYKA